MEEILDVVAPDGFEVTAETPYATSQLRLSKLFAWVAEHYDVSRMSGQQCVPTQDSLVMKEVNKEVNEEVNKEANAANRRDMLFALCHRSLFLAERAEGAGFSVPGVQGQLNRIQNNHFYATLNRVLISLFNNVIAKPLELDIEQIRALLQHCVLWVEFDLKYHPFTVNKPSKANLVEKYVTPLLTFLSQYPPVAEVAPELRPQLDRLHLQIIPAWVKFTQIMAKIYGYEAWKIMKPGASWCNSILSDLGAMPPERRDLWLELLRYANTAEGTKPTKKWLKEADRLRQLVGLTEFREHVLRWMSLFHTEYYYGYHEIGYIHGLVWMMALYSAEDVEICNAVEHVAREAGDGYSCRHAAYHVLGMLPGREPLFALVRLQSKTTYVHSQQYLERLLKAAAARQGMTTYDMADIIVPTYGMDADGVLNRSFGECRVAIDFMGDKPLWTWFGANGKSRKTVPPDVKTAHGAALAALKTYVGEIVAMRELQQERVEHFYRTQHSWRLTDWKRRYIGHPLLGGIARRLIWQLALPVSNEKNEKTERTEKTDLVPALWREGRLEDVEGNPIDLERVPDADSAVRVELWHPVGAEVDAVLRWRARLDALGIVQPFKQAYREAYLLTDAERTTGIYSNRFAAHIIRQFVFHRQCKKLGWNNRIRIVNGMSDKRAMFRLPDWQLQAELWIEPVDDPHMLENGSQSYNYLSTDQVRFRKVSKGRITRNPQNGEANPHQDAVHLEEVNPRLFWEIMRDVDAMIARASIANDPTWQDRGIMLSLMEDGAARYIYKGAELGINERRAMLERLLPRLQIASRCTVSDPFLIVHGDVRTYKIHLGSGNILMEPNDQYLCIIRSRAGAGEATVHPGALSFEGDSTLSMILSKAMLLASDSTVTDPVILQQIRSKR